LYRTLLCKSDAGKTVNDQSDVSPSSVRVEGARSSLLGMSKTLLSLISQGAA